MFFGKSTRVLSEGLPSSHRLVPVHQELQGLGDGRLFPDNLEIADHNAKTNGVLNRFPALEAPLSEEAMAPSDSREPRKCSPERSLSERLSDLAPCPCNYATPTHV